MAYLTPTTLTCPSCGFKGKVETVTGAGPGMRKGDIPYRSYMSAGPFTEHLDAQGKKTGSLLCPQDGTPVWTNQPSVLAFGPITSQEHERTEHRRSPMAPGNGKSIFGVRAQGPMQPVWMKKRKRPVKRSS